MSDDHQWRQLGSVVNAVLMETRTKAMRRGALSKAPERQLARSAIREADGLAPAKLGNGFLAGNAPRVSKPVQLELPFGIATAPHAEQPSRMSRAARLM